MMCLILLLYNRSGSTFYKWWKVERKAAKELGKLTRDVFHFYSNKATSVVRAINLHQMQTAKQTVFSNVQYFREDDIFQSI